METGAYHSIVEKTPETSIEQPAWARIAEGLMRDQGVTQEDLAPLIGVKTRGAVGHYFRGRREPSIDQLAAIAHRLGVTVSELIGEIPLAADPEDRREIYELLDQIGDDNLPLLKRMLAAAAQEQK